MLGKLLKYDFAMWKQFAIVWPAAVVLALVDRLLLWMNAEEATKLGGVLMVVLSMAFFAILVALFVLSLVFIIQRFYKGLLGDEGYLMHTLPVRPWQLMTSKLICSVVVMTISALVALLSIFLLVPASLTDYKHLFQLFGHALGDIFSASDSALAVLESLLCIFVGMVTSYLQFYLAMAIGHLFNKNRISMSVVAYFAINLIVSVLTSLLGITAFQPAFEVFNHTSPGHSAMAAFHGVLWASILGSAVLSAIYFFATNYILSRRLNLE